MSAVVAGRLVAHLLSVRAGGVASNVVTPEDSLHQSIWKTLSGVAVVENKYVKQDGEVSLL